MSADRPPGPDEPGIIDLFDSASVEMWCAALRVGTAELVSAVQAVGNSGSDVAEYIRVHRTTSRRM
jgi:hypothetical protein